MLGPLELLRHEPAGPAATRGNLPAEVSSFVGRDREVRTVRQLIAAHRLVTLLGPGGSGKTRLSVEVGSRLAGAVWRVELASVTDPAEVPQAVLSALDLTGQVQIRKAQAPLDRLREAVAGRDLLLILDNCEHLVAAPARVADTLLRAAPGLRLLTTSREPLGIPGERLFAVEPLALPPADADATTAAGFPSVRLLLDRAAGFRLTARAAPRGSPSSRPMSSRFSTPVRLSSTDAYWPVSPIRLRTRWAWRTTSKPPTVACPASGRVRVASTRTAVVRRLRAGGPAAGRRSRRWRRRARRCR